MKSNAPRSKLGRAINSIEETIIALILGLMTAITFANVIVRYFFDSNILWQLEATVFLFAWLVLFGMSHCIKITAHLGVDVIINVLSPGMRKVFSLASVAISMIFCLIMLKSGWEYWSKFATTAAFLQTKDIPMPGFLQFLADITNDGKPYEKLPRYIPYFILPFGMALLGFRLLEAAYLILTTSKDRIIASHEAEDLVEDAAAKVAREA